MKAQLKLVALLATLLPCSVVAQQIQIESATDRFGKQVWIERNTLTGGAERVTGMAINTRDYAVAADELTEQTVALVAAGIASDYAEITGIAAGNLDLRSIRRAEREVVRFVSSNV